MLDYIEISDDDFNEIIQVVGYPFLNLEEDILEIDKQGIITHVVRPSLRDYYTYNPIKLEKSYIVNTTFSFDFPDDNVFNVIQCNINQNHPNLTLSLPQTNPYVNALNYSVVRGDKGYHRERAETMQYMKGISKGDLWESVKYNIDFDNKKLKGYTNIRGYLNVIWALCDSNFSNIKFEHKNDVITYCQGKLMLWYGRIHSFQTSNLPNEVDWDSFKTDGQEMIESILTKWKSKTKPILLSN